MDENKSYKSISIDVGIKNLSTCQITHYTSTGNFKIDFWDNTSLMTNNITSDIIQKCSMCSRKSTYLKNTHYFCTQHAKMSDGIFSSNLTKLTFLKAKPLLYLSDRCVQYSILKPDDILKNKYKKNELLEMIQCHLKNNMLVGIKPKKQSSKTVDLSIIGRSIVTYFDNAFPELNMINRLLIEHQIGPLANRMKTIQGMLVQYFIMRNPNIQIDCVSATVKLKPFLFKNDSVKTYKDRKRLGTQACEHLLKMNDEWLDIMLNSKKKDDLCDCFLQLWATCIWDKNTKICL